jgi:hypothetical protein
MVTKPNQDRPTMQSVDAATLAIVAAFESRLKALLNWCREHPEASPQDLLSQTVTVVEQTERAVFAAALEQAGRYEAAPACPSCRQRMHGHDRQSRTVVTLRGERRAAYRRWRCRHCRVIACPRYAGWQARHQLAPDVQEVALRLCCGMPYRAAEEVLGRLGLAVSDNTLQRLVDEVGGGLASQQVAAAEAVAALQECRRADHAPERLYLLCDGLQARIEGRWREVRLGVCYATAAVEPDETGQPPAAEHRLVRGWLADCDTFCERFYAQAQEAGLLSADEVISLADGAAWIWERLPHFPLPGSRPREILDFYHAAENVAKAVRAVWGEGTAATTQQFEQLRRWLRAGDVAAVLDRLRSWQARVEGEALRQVTNVLHYLQTHRHRMGYLELKLAGYHIGSGHVESSCKHVGLRLKRPGANWSEPGVTAMLALLGWCWSDDTAQQSVLSHAA